MQSARALAIVAAAMFIAVSAPSSSASSGSHTWNGGPGYCASLTITGNTQYVQVSPDGFGYYVIHWTASWNWPYFCWGMLRIDFNPGASGSVSGVNACAGLTCQASFSTSALYGIYSYICHDGGPCDWEWYTVTYYMSGTLTLIAS